jgi:short-subunit dehydrogenase
MGIGEAIAFKLAEQGVNIALVSRSKVSRGYRRRLGQFSHWNCRTSSKQYTMRSKPRATG